MTVLNRRPPLRRELFTQRRPAGSAIVALIVLPHLVRQIRSGWPTLEFIRNAHNLKNVAMSPVASWSDLGLPRLENRPDPRARKGAVRD